MLTTGDKQREGLSLSTATLKPLLKRQKAGDDIRKNMGIILDKPMFFQFTRLEKREESFKHWPSSSGQDPYKLAEAGFFYDGQVDRVRCFHCSLSMQDWTKEIDPWTVHAKLYPYCAHVRQCLGDAYVLEVLECTSDTDRTPVDKTELDLAICRNRDAYDAVLSIYTDETLVRKSLEYLLNGHHYRTFSGTDLAEVVEKNREIQVSDIDTYLTENSRTSGVTILGDTNLEDGDDLNNVDNLEEENRALKDSMACKICFDRFACIVTLPCGHMSSCAQCISSLFKCPLCRQSIKGSIRAQCV